MYPPPISTANAPMRPNQLPHPAGLIRRLQDRESQAQVNNTLAARQAELTSMAMRSFSTDISPMMRYPHNQQFNHQGSLGKLQVPQNLGLMTVYE